AMYHAAVEINGFSSHQYQIITYLLSMMGYLLSHKQRVLGEGIDSHCFIRSDSKCLAQSGLGVRLAYVQYGQLTTGLFFYFNGSRQGVIIVGADDKLYS